MARWAMVSMAFACLFSAGCKKRTPAAPAVAKAPLPGVLTNRMSDAAYLGALQTNRNEQTALAGERSVIVRKMESCITRVKATLPQDADEAALKAALAKDDEWRTLEPQNAQAIASIQQTLSQAREKVRQRMLEESRAVKAVAEGQAKAVDQTAGKK